MTSRSVKRSLRSWQTGIPTVAVGITLTVSILVTGVGWSESPPQVAREPPEITPAGAASAVPPHTKIGKHTVEEWRTIIDDYWGAGAETSEKVRIFDAAWDNLDQEYGAYMNLDVDMRALRRRYRQEIRDGVSKGRFAAIMNHLSLAMNDAHTAIMQRSVNWETRIQNGTPLFVVGAWSDNWPFGAALTPMPDGSLLVYRVRPNHVLGIEPGDLVIGYDGVPWKDLYQQLLAAELPIRLQWVWGSTDLSMEHAMLISASMNWHLFDTIDIQKYGSEEITSLPTDLLLGQSGTIWGNSNTYYDKPIAVLTGPGAVSNGDWESLRMGFHPMVRTFGKPSNGAFTSSDEPNLGEDWWFTKATGSGYLVDGHQYLAHTGVQVDEEVWLTRDDVAQGRDTVVEAAIEWIRSRSPRHATGRRRP
jgi:hypothetical protein